MKSSFKLGKKNSGLDSTAAQGYFGLHEALSHTDAGNEQRCLQIAISDDRGSHSRGWETQLRGRGSAERAMERLRGGEIWLQSSEWGPPCKPLICSDLESRDFQRLRSGYPLSPRIPGTLSTSHSAFTQAAVCQLLSKSPKYSGPG